MLVWHTACHHSDHSSFLWFESTLMLCFTQYDTVTAQLLDKHILLLLCAHVFASGGEMSDAVWLCLFLWKLVPCKTRQRAECFYRQFVFTKYHKWETSNNLLGKIYIYYLCWCNKNINTLNSLTIAVFRHRMVNLGMLMWE